MHVLVVCDPVATKQGLLRWLRADAFQIEIAETGEDAIDLASRYEFDIVLLGLQLPDLKATEVIRRMRGGRISAPILALSPTPHTAPRIAALGAGADDVMALPLDGTELSARIRAIVRRSHGHSQQVLSAGGVSIDMVSREVTVAGKSVHLTRKESAILELLILRQNTPLTQEMFLNHLYSDADSEPVAKIIDVFICKLRRKLADAGAPNLIETIWGRGYMVRSTAQDRTPQTTPAAEKLTYKNVRERV